MAVVAAAEAVAAGETVAAEAVVATEAAVVTAAAGEHLDRTQRVAAEAGIRVGQVAE